MTRAAEATAERTHWVRVNEVHIMHRGREVADWWAHYRMRAERVDRVRILAAHMIGDEVLVACTDQEHAQWLAGLIHSRGVSKTAVKAVSFRAGAEPADIMTIEAVSEDV